MIFRARASKASELLGKIGLTETQAKRLEELKAKAVGGLKPLTAIQSKELNELIEKSTNLELPQGAKTYVNQSIVEEWSGNKKEFWSKETEKGQLCESEAIEAVEFVRGEFLLSKNEQQFEGKYFTGCPDVVNSSPIGHEIKCPWDAESFAKKKGVVDKNYYVQCQVYMYLTGKREWHLHYVLLNTPEHLNYGVEVSFDHIPIEQRVYTQVFKYNKELIKLLKRRVVMANRYYHKEKELFLLNQIDYVNFDMEITK